MRRTIASLAGSALAATLCVAQAHAQDVAPVPPSPRAPDWSLTPGETREQADPDVQGPRAPDQPAPRAIGREPTRARQPTPTPAPAVRVPTPAPSAPATGARPPPTAPDGQNTRPRSTPLQPRAVPESSTPQPSGEVPQDDSAPPSVLTPTLPAPEAEYAIDPEETPPAPVSDGAATDQNEGGWGWLIGLLAALAAALAGFFLLRRRHSRAASELVYARPEPADAAPARAGKAVAPRAQPAPPVYVPPSAPAAGPAVPEKSRIQLDFQPGGGRLSPDGLLIGYRLLFRNVSNETLTDVVVYLNFRSADHDPALGMRRPDAPEVTLATLGPLGSTMHDGELLLPSAAFRLLQSNGRNMIVPVIDLLPSYRDARGMIHEIRATLLLGRESTPPGGKMAPFWLDNAVIQFDRLGIRPIDIPGRREAA